MKGRYITLEWIALMRANKHKNAQCDPARHTRHLQLSKHAHTAMSEPDGLIMCIML